MWAKLRKVFALLWGHKAQIATVVDEIKAAKQ